MPTTLLLDSLIRSIQVGSLYVLMAIGLTLTLAVMRLPNFAHAELITVGAYVALVSTNWITGNLLLTMAFCFIVAALVALVSHKVVYQPLEHINSSIYTMILATFALGLIWRYIIFILVDFFRLYDLRIKFPVAIWYQGQSMTLTNIFFWVAPTAIVLIIALSLLLNYTGLGREMRALADNRSLARVIGVPVDRVVNMTWILAGGLAGVAGALWGVQTSVNPLMGFLAILSVFAATILGGMTSFSGTILGAYVVGLSENLVMQLLNYYVGLDFSFKPAIPFIIIILVLLFRPQGLTGFTESLRTRTIRRSPLPQ